MRPDNSSPATAQIISIVTKPAENADAPQVVDGICPNPSCKRDLHNEIDDFLKRKLALKHCPGCGIGLGEIIRRKFHCGACHTVLAVEIPDPSRDVFCAQCGIKFKYPHVPANDLPKQ